MAKRLNHIERKLKRQIEGHTILITRHELDLIEEAVSVYKRDHGDDFTAFEFQALLDDIDQIRTEWECEA